MPDLADYLELTAAAVDTPHAHSIESWLPRFPLQRIRWSASFLAEVRYASSSSSRRWV